MIEWLLDLLLGAGSRADVAGSKARVLKEDCHG
jgi:hypothetical protein